MACRKKLSLFFVAAALQTALTLVEALDDNLDQSNANASFHVVSSHETLVSHCYEKCERLCGLWFTNGGRKAAKRYSASDEGKTLKLLEMVRYYDFDGVRFVAVNFDTAPAAFSKAMLGSGLYPEQGSKRKLAAPVLVLLACSAYGKAQKPKWMRARGLPEADRLLKVVVFGDGGQAVEFNKVPGGAFPPWNESSQPYKPNAKKKSEL